MLEISKINTLCTGLSCIDVIKSNNEELVLLGGTSANVASILSMLGFCTAFLQADYTGTNSRWLYREFEKRKIKIIKFNKNSLDAPCIIEELKNGQHKFITTCPMCKKKTNEIKLPNSQQIKKTFNDFNLNLFYYDRMSAGIKDIAHKNQTGWNVYEPNSIRVYNTFLSSIRDANIIKISQENISTKYIERMKKDLSLSTVKILIVTLGNNGVKYSYKKNEKLSDWIYVNANDVKDFVDSSGAGDWLTATFLYNFLRNYPYYTDSIAEEVVEKCLIKAQQAAAYSCSFIGAQSIFESKSGIINMNKILDSSISLLSHNKFVNYGCSYCKK